MLIGGEKRRVNPCSFRVEEEKAGGGVMIQLQPSNVSGGSDKEISVGAPVIG